VRTYSRGRLGKEAIMMRKAMLLLSAVVALSLLPSAASAQTVVVDQQLNNAAVLLARFGWERVDNVKGTLLEGGIDLVDTRLRGARQGQYMVVGACDAFCDDLDIALFNGSGQVVDYNVDAVNLPYVRIDDPNRSHHSVAVEMVRCYLEPCAYGLAVFRR
jgi:hypothetical protein